MRNFGERIAHIHCMWNFFRACAHCGMFWPPIDLYCEPCWQSLFQQASLQGKMEGRWMVQSLWRWSKKDQQLGQYLKLRKSLLFANSQWRLVQLMKQQGLQVNVDWLVYPRNHLLEEDHASVAGQIFARHFCLKEILGVELGPSILYKKQGRRERKIQRKARRPEGLADELSQKKICFFDDIYTTGATAEAVWRALGRPNDYQIVVFAHKTLK